MLDKAKLGSRYTCFKCGTKFYDLNRPVPSCPECSADQREAPARDIRALLGKGGPVRRYTEDEDEVDVGEGGDDDDDLGLISDDDDDDDDVEMDEDDEMMEEGGGDEED